MEKNKPVWLLFVIFAVVVVYYVIPVEIGYILERFDFSYPYWMAFVGFYGGIVFLSAVTKNVKYGSVYIKVTIFAIIVAEVALYLN